MIANGRRIGDDWRRSAHDRSELRLEGVNLARELDGGNSSARSLTMRLKWSAPRPA